jgi:hypothetical protein
MSLSLALAFSFPSFHKCMILFPNAVKSNTDIDADFDELFGGSQTRVTEEGRYILYYYIIIY